MSKPSREPPKAKRKEKMEKEPKMEKVKKMEKGKKRAKRNHAISLQRSTKDVTKASSVKDITER